MPLRMTPAWPHVALAVIWVVVTQLRGEVCRRADHGVGDLAGRGHQLADPEVCHLELRPRREQHVGRLEVPVHCKAGSPVSPRRLFFVRFKSRAKN